MPVLPKKAVFVTNTKLHPDFRGRLETDPSFLKYIFNISELKKSLSESISNTNISYKNVKLTDDDISTKTFDMFKHLLRMYEKYDMNYRENNLMHGYTVVKKFVVSSFEEYMKYIKHFILKDPSFYGVLVSLDKTSSTNSKINLISPVINRSDIESLIKDHGELEVFSYHFDNDKYKNYKTKILTDIKNDNETRKSYNIFKDTIDYILDNTTDLYEEFINFKDDLIDKIKISNLRYVSDTGEIKIDIDFKSINSKRAFIIHSIADVDGYLYPSYGYSYIDFGHNNSDLTNNCVYTTGTPNINVHFDESIQSAPKSASLCVGSEKRIKNSLYVLKDKNYRSPYYDPYIVLPAYVFTMLYNLTSLIQQM